MNKMHESQETIQADKEAAISELCDIVMPKFERMLSLSNGNMIYGSDLTAMDVQYYQEFL